MRWNPAPLLLLFGAAVLVGVALWQDRPPAMLPLEALTGFQDAGSPLLLPEDGEPRHRLDEPSPWMVAGIPVALRFDAPAGSERGALTMEKDGAITGIGGGATAAGDPVFAVADGLVLSVGNRDGSAGQWVTLGHRTAGGALLKSVYGPMAAVQVAVGSLVPRGKRIGTFDVSGAIRHEMGPLSPSGSGDEADDLMPSVLGVVLSVGMEPWTELEIQGAEKLGEILGK